MYLDFSYFDYLLTNFPDPLPKILTKYILNFLKTFSRKFKQICLNCHCPKYYSEISAPYTLISPDHCRPLYLAKLCYHLLLKFKLYFLTVLNFPSDIP